MFRRLFGMNSGDCGVTCDFFIDIGESRLSLLRPEDNPYVGVETFCRLIYVASLLSDGTPLGGEKNIGSIAQCGLNFFLFLRVSYGRSTTAQQQPSRRCLGLVLRPAGTAAAGLR